MVGVSFFQFPCHIDRLRIVGSGLELACIEREIQRKKSKVNHCIRFTSRRSLLKSVFHFQFFTLTKNNEIQFNDDKCLDAPQSEPGSFVEMITCHGLRGNQEWKHDKKKVNNNP